MRHHQRRPSLLTPRSPPLQKQKDTNNILDLPSLLIMPIQRIPRYKMLLEVRIAVPALYHANVIITDMNNDGLQQVVKFTPETHHDYKALTNALERVRLASLVSITISVSGVLCVLCAVC